MDWSGHWSQQILNYRGLTPFAVIDRPHSTTCSEFGLTNKTQAKCGQSWITGCATKEKPKKAKGVSRFKPARRFSPPTEGRQFATRGLLQMWVGCGHCVSGWVTGRLRNRKSWIVTKRVSVKKVAVNKVAIVLGMQRLFFLPKLEQNRIGDQHYSHYRHIFL